METKSGTAPSAGPVTRAVSGGSDGWMPSVPAEVRGQIRSGMRWTVWLSVLAVPFSYGTSVLLARTSPETIGTYGLLTVYIGLVSSIFYLGGGAVIIKFLPELKADNRPSFLLSYFLVICISLAPWLALAALFPDKLHYLFGRDAGSGFLLFVLCLAPIPILFFMIRAIFKASLDFRRAQLLGRLVTIGSFLTYAMLFLYYRPWLALHPTEIIWSVYLALVSLAVVVGLYWLRAESRSGRPAFSEGPGRGDSRKRRGLRFWLPRGFWTYTLGTEGTSLLGFFLQRLDYILVLSFGGLRLLGEYVVVTTLALYIPLISTYFYDTLLPSLTNLLAVGNRQGAAEAFRAHMRLLLLVIAAGTCGLIFLASPLVGIFGPTYKTLAFPVIVLAALVGLASPGATGGTLLFGIGKPQRSVWVSLFQVGVFAGLFFALWPRLHLLGAVLALGTSMLVGNVLMLIVARMSAPFRVAVAWDYARFAAVVSASGLVAWRWPVQSWYLGLPAWALSVVLFLAVGTYRRADCLELWHWVMPSPMNLRRKPGRSIAGSTAH